MERILTIIVCVSIVLNPVLASPEPGLWNVEISEEHRQAMFTKSLYQGANIRLKLLCSSEKPEASGSVLKVAVRFAGRMTQCQGEFNDIDDPEVQDHADYYINAAYTSVVADEHILYFVDNVDTWYDCDNSYIILKDHGSSGWITVQSNDTSVADIEEASYEAEAKQTTLAVAIKPKQRKPTIKSDEKTDDGELSDAARKKRAVARSKSREDSVADVKATKVSRSNSNVTAIQKPAVSDDGMHRIAVAKEDGIYLFAFVFECAFFSAKGLINQNDHTCDFKIAMTMEMHHDRFGYLSAIDWPQLPFYATMCAVYAIYTLTWITLCLCYWRELIRLQFWIAAVILLGLIEKSIFLAEYQSVFATGLSVLPGAVVIAEIISALKRTLARILIVIVSVGFGIVRPRLGPIFNRVLLIGAVYFICASIEGCLRQLHAKGDNSWLILLSVFPLALIDAILCCWIFTALVHTIRQLRVRRNVVKLSLYKHFTNVLIFAVLASLVYMIWSAVEHKMVKCLTDWKELWMDEAFWQMLFSTILLAIIILFRPSNNAVKYAFQPLPDADEDGEAGSEEDEVVMSNLAEDVKKKQRGTEKEKEKDRENGKTQANAKADTDDLKWVEENIPVTDGVLPSLLDSDEEIMASKYERNKME